MLEGRSDKQLTVWRRWQQIIHVADDKAKWLQPLLLTAGTVKLW